MEDATQEFLKIVSDIRLFGGPLTVTVMLLTEEMENIERRCLQFTSR